MLHAQTYWQTRITNNKKLRYREEHSASVVLIWCTLWHFLGENQLMANQPLLPNWSRKVIQGHRFWYQSKAHSRLPISD